MKLITLNTWAGRAGKEGIISFFEKYKDEVDVFCLQEIWSAPYKDFDGHMAGGIPIDHGMIMTKGKQEISKILSSHISYFRPHFLDNYGLMMSVHNKYKIIAEGELFVYKEKGHIPKGDIGNHARNIQYVTMIVNEKILNIINFHGLWNGKGKTDTDDRLNQSKNIINFIKSLQGETILSGDFNLLPDTESIRLFEEFGLRNLIKDYDIKSTRTSFYKKPEKFADYIFISKGIKIIDFKVLPDEISDHSALMLEFN